MKKSKEAEAEFKAKPQRNHEKQKKKRLPQKMLGKRPQKPQPRQKKRKQLEGKVKRTKKSRTIGNETLAYLREKAAKDHEVRMLQMKTQNEDTRAQRLLLEQYHQQQQQSKLSNKCYYSCRINNRQ